MKGFYWRRKTGLFNSENDPLSNKKSPRYKNNFKNPLNNGPLNAEEFYKSQKKNIVIYKKVKKADELSFLEPLLLHVKKHGDHSLLNVFVYSSPTKIVMERRIKLINDQIPELNWNRERKRFKKKKIKINP